MECLFKLNLELIVNRNVFPITKSPAGFCVGNSQDRNRLRGAYGPPSLSLYLQMGQLFAIH